METSSSARRTRALAMVVGLLMLPACQGSAGPADTTGSDNVVLHLASIDAVNVDGHSFGPQTFVDSLASVSAGRLTAQVAEGYGDGSAEVERPRSGSAEVARPRSGSAELERPRSGVATVSEQEG